MDSGVSTGLMALHFLAPFALFAASELLLRMGCQDKEDFIGQLPDDILSVILSHLNMREAARTKLVSRRWRHLLSSASCLDFTLVTMFGPPPYEDRICVCQRDVHKFVEGVNAYLKCYQDWAITSIKFCFCFETMFAADVDQWLSFAVGMGVRELELCCSCKWAGPWRCRYTRDQFYVFSFELIANSKLKQLCLDSCTIRRDFNGQFHSLCILDISYILLSQTDVQYILLTCVNLEQLRLFACTLPANLSICGPSVRLKVLTLDLCEGIHKLEAPSLITFESFFTSIPSISIVPCLKNWFSNVDLENDAYFSGQLARDVPRLESVSLLCPGSLVPNLPRSWNTFSNLKHLELYFWLGVQYDLVYIILPFLKACPLLEKFHLMLPWWVKKMEPFDVVEKLHLTTLKEVEFGGFHGSEMEIQLATYLIENAISLERLVLSTGYRVYKGFDKFIYGCKVTMREVKRRWILYRLERKALSSRSRVKIQVNNKFPGVKVVC